MEKILTINSIRAKLGFRPLLGKGEFPMKEMIVATGLDGAIGKNNKLLWDLKDDMKHFVEITKGRNVVMGRKTLDSLPNGPLKGRNNIVISNTTIGSFRIDETTGLYFRTYEEFLAENIDDYVVIGGAQIYELFMANIEKIYVTLVFDTFREADTHIPAIPAEWIPQAVEFYPADERNSHPFHIVEMTRR
jgi:dihydrofolate reductase